MRWLWRADLGIKEIAYRTAQNLYSLHGSRQFTRAPKVRVTVSASLLMDRVQIKILRGTPSFLLFREVQAESAFTSEREH